VARLEAASHFGVRFMGVVEFQFREVKAHIPAPPIQHLRFDAVVGWFRAAS
jgi:hypothetical protein